jgi:putative FmdB family regulatory protein
MPTYEYHCEKCGKDFSLILSLSEHEQKQKCPYCKSQKITQQVSTFIPKTTRKA